MKKIHSALITLCFASAICLATPKAHAQNIVHNPGFEAGTSFAPSWTLIDPNMPPPLSNIGTNPTFAHSGMNHANLGTADNPPLSATLSQVLSTTPGARVYFVFLAGARHNHPWPPVSNMFQVFFGGVMVQSLTNVGMFGYTQFTFANVLAPTGVNTFGISFL